MVADRRLGLVGVVAAVVCYACVLIFWASQPLHDSVPVGVDYTLKTPTPVSASVRCNTLFDSDARSGAPLPLLKEQPDEAPPLAFQREPCAVVHSHARIVFALDTALFGAALVCFVWLALRRRRASSPDDVRSDAGATSYA